MNIIAAIRLTSDLDHTNTASRSEVKKAKTMIKRFKWALPYKIMTTPPEFHNCIADNKV